MTDRTHVSAKLSPESVTAIESIQRAWPQMSRSAAIELALIEWKRNHSGENKKDAKLASVNNELMAIRIEMGQIRAQLMALMTTVGERNHDINRRNEENKHGLLLPPSNGEGAAG